VTALSFEPIKLRFNTATAIFAASKQEWDQALQEANAIEEARRLLASVPSVPNGLDGQSLRPHPTNVHFEFLRILGHGTHGQVSEVREPTTSQLYARKLIRFRLDSRSQSIIEDQVRSEVTIMQKLHHPHIASVLFYVRDLDAFSIIMLPVANCDLRHFLESDCANNANAAVKQLDAWFGCLVGALTYAHSERVKHHDIKPSNILIKDGSPYLSDFGSAKDFSEQDTSISTNDLIAGTPVYYAPEKPPWGRAADVFALGCVFSEMLTVRCGRKLHEYRDFRRVPDRENGFAFRENLPKVGEWLANLEPPLSEPLKLVYRQTLKMLEVEPECRCEAKYVKRKFRSEDDTLFCNSCC
jgi:serine/threonine protein kinase